MPLNTAAAVLARARQAAVLLASVRDVVEERASLHAPPTWCVRRGWTEFLTQLPEEALRRAERDGLAMHVAQLRGAPPDLVQLAHAIAALTDFGAASPARLFVNDPRRASPRKLAQVASFSALIEPLARESQRVIDVGSGHGHLTRQLASATGLPAEGWERDPARVAVATALAPIGGPRFVVRDARTDAGRIARGDLVVGLHACGALGDDAVRFARAAGASIALLGCCPQKRERARVALWVPHGLDAHALTVDRAALGLCNAFDGEGGVEEALAARTQARVRRFAVAIALARAGSAVAPGEEMRGVNRRRAVGSLAELGSRVFAVRRLPPPTGQDLSDALRAARAGYRLARRWELPRRMLARMLESWIALDRAAHLAEAGYDVEIVPAFELAISPRNLAVLARPPSTHRAL